MLDQRARNALAGAYLRSDAGTSEDFVAVDNDRFGLVLSANASGWSFDSVEVSDTGLTARAPSGTGVQVYGGSGNVFRRVVALRSPGHGLAVTKGNLDGRAPTENRFDEVVLDGSGAFDSDPRLHLSGGAARNVFVDVSVRAHTFGLSVGEGYDPPTNDGNSFASLRAESCSGGAITLRGGSANRFRRVTAVACATRFPCSALGLIDFRGAATHDKVVSEFDATGNVVVGAGPPGRVSDGSGANDFRVSG